MFREDETMGERDDRERGTMADPDGGDEGADRVTPGNGGEGAPGEAEAATTPDAPGTAGATDAAAESAGAEAPPSTDGPAAGGGGDGNGWNGSAPAAADASVAELTRLQAEIQRLNDRHLRLAAEFDNYRKRVERERAEQHQRSQAALVARLLDALDDLQRVEHFDPAQVTAQSLLEALDLVERKFRQALESAGLSELAANGEIFDPRTMEAVMAVPAEHPEEDEVVADVFRKGYRFGNTLVRPAQVAVKKYEG